MADWPKAEGTRIEVAGEIRAAAEGVDLPEYDDVALARSFAFCKDAKQAADKLVNATAGAVGMSKALEIIEKATAARRAIIADQKSNRDVSDGRIKK